MVACSGEGGAAALAGRELAARLAAAGLPSCDELLATQAGASLGQCIIERAVPFILDAYLSAPPAHLKELLLAKLGLLASLKEVCGATEALHERSLPQVVTLREGDQREDFRLCGLDADGRPIYQSGFDEGGCGFIAFHELPELPGRAAPGGLPYGVWAARTTRDGRQPGAWQLDCFSELPTGAGSWQGPDGTRAPCVVVCERADSAPPKHGCRGLDDFLALLKEGHLDAVPGLLAAAHHFATAWAGFAHALGVGDVAPPSAPTWPEVIGALEAVAAASLGVCIERELPADPSPQLAQLLHALVAQSLLRQARGSMRTVDVASQCWSDGLLAPSVPGAQHFHLVSDTHEWDGWLGLPGGDVLLHCGDIMLDSGPLDAGGEPPRLASTLKDLHELARLYRWVFFVGGNHDRTLHDLWAQDHARLCGLLPDNIVMLHCAPDLLEPPLPSGVAARDAAAAAAAKDGAVRLLPDMSLCAPAERDGEGWVIAGCGCSQSQNNSAFQFAKGDEAGRQRAYAALIRHKPHIVLTHGPPSDDKLLKEAVLNCPSVRVHAFGHTHHLYGVNFDGRKALINASIAGPGLPPFGMMLPVHRPVGFYL